MRSEIPKILLCLLFSWQFALAQPQVTPEADSPKQEAVAKPFRRIFVPQAELPELQLDNLRPLEIDKLPSALERIVRRNNESIDPWISSMHGLRAFHAVAQLVNADLYSDRTRLMWEAGRSNPKIDSLENSFRERLTPWNLAIENSYEELNFSQTSPINQPPTSSRVDSDLNTINPGITAQPLWGFDSNGRPNLLNRGAETWIRWSLRPTADSTPNRLSYEALVPETVDGCIVLLLPQTAKIEQSNVVVRKLEAWEQAAERLVGWPEQNPSLGSNSKNTVESAYWMLETSGREKITFSIALGPDSSRGQILEQQEKWGIERLFSRQTLQYSLHAQELRAMGEWEWNEPTGANPPIQLELPPGMKVRSVTINDREAALQLQGNTVIISVPESTSIAGFGLANRLKMNADFLLPRSELKPGENGNWLIPAVRNKNGAVLFGTTILQDQSDGKFVAVSIDRCRLESNRKTPEGFHRLEYSWNRSPPEVYCSILNHNDPNPLESLVRLSTEPDRCVASVRIRFDQSSARGLRTIAIPPGWIVDANSLQIKPQFQAGAISFVEPENSILVDTNRLTVSESIVDFQIHRTLEAGSPLDLAQAPWITVRGEKLKTCLTIEPSAGNRLRINGKIRDWTVPEEDLTPWQRDSLPRLGRALVLAIKDDQLPPLVASSLEGRISVPIESSVRRIDTQWRVEHRFKVTSEWKDLSQLHVQLPNGFQWYCEHQKRLPINAEFNESTSEWTLEIGSINFDSEKLTPSVIVATQIVSSNQPTLQLLTPAIREAQQLAFKLDLSGDLIIRNPVGKSAKQIDGMEGHSYEWTEDSNTENFSSQETQSSRTLLILDPDYPSLPSPRLYEATLDLFADSYGDQIAYITSQIAFKRDAPSEIVVQVPTDWRISQAFLEGRGDKHEATIVKESSKSFRLGFDHARIYGASVITMQLVGPKTLQTSQAFGGSLRLLSKVYQRQLSVRVPEIEVNHQKINLTSAQIWFPAQLSIVTTDTHENDRQETWWPTRTWALATWKTLLPDLEWISANTDSLLLNPTRSITMPPGKWRAIRVDQTDQISKREFVLKSSRRPQWLLWLTVCSAFISAGLFFRWPKSLFLVTVAVWLGAIWLIPPWAAYCQQLFLGIAVGAILCRIHQIISPPPSQGSSHTRLDRLNSWDPRQGSEELNLQNEERKSLRTGSLNSFLLWAILPLGLVTNTLTQIKPVFSQDPLDSSARVFDILIPINEQGEIAGTTIYVPTELSNLIDQEEREKRQRESSALIGASKHLLRLDSRSFGFGSTDQPFTSSYEMWISEAAVGRVVRIPFPSDSLKLSRFSVDGIEVLSSRFSRTETELLWFPDRPGRRSIQIEAQVRMRSLEAPPPGVSFGLLSGANPTVAGLPANSEKRSSKVWSISTDILPVGNAVFEVETDGAWMVSVASFGRSVNPAVGRSIVQLGNKERVEGYFQPPSSFGNRPSLLAMPNDSAPGTGDLPSMNTELFMDHERLLAKTVIEYPTAIATAEDVEIEADLQWLPIGTQWGDAKLIDIRSGSTLDRRRYVVRWNAATPNDSETPVSNPQKRLITATWIPIGEGPLRSVLFAECRDRRVRQGVLRYARTPGSAWTLDGISSWIPAINSKERLDWPELRDPPLSTNLRIPANSGFGVLRRQLLATKEQLTASNRIHLGVDKARLSTTLKINGPIAKGSPLILEIPLGYQVQRVLTLNGGLETISWTKDEKNYLQILVDRHSDSVGELVVESSKSLSDQATEPIPFLLPEIQASIAWSSPQTYALSADPSWTILETNSDPSQSQRLQGRGDEEILFKSTVGNAVNSSVQIQRTGSSWDGLLVVRIPSIDSGLGIQVCGIRDPVDSTPWHGIELAIPKDLFLSWSSKNPTDELMHLGWNHRILSIDPIPNRSNTNEHKGVDFEIELSTELNGSLDPKLLELIEVNGQSPRRIVIAFENGNSQLGAILTSKTTTANLESFIREALGLSQDEWSVRTMNPLGSQSSPLREATRSEYEQKLSKHCLTDGLFQSTFWLERPTGSIHHGNLHWTIPEAWTCSMVQINGRMIPFEQDGNKLDVLYPSLSTCIHVQLWFSVPEPFSTQSLKNQNLPSLEGSANPSNTITQSDHDQMGFDPIQFHLEYKAWMNHLGQTFDNETWRYAADHLTRLLWLSTNPIQPKDAWLSDDEFAEGVRTLTELPWASFEDYRRTIDSSRRSVALHLLTADHSIDSDLRATASIESWLRPSTPHRWFQSVIPLCVLACAIWLWTKNRNWLQNRPWWNLLSLASVWWLISGDLWGPSLACLIAAILAIDTYLMTTWQFRQTGIRGPR